MALGIDGSATSDAPRKSDVASLVGAYRVTTQDRLFGGFSALWVDAHGTRFIAVSDRNAYVTGRMLRDADGAVVSLRLGPVTGLKSTEKKMKSWEGTDSEGIAIGQDGDVYVSYETTSRIARFSGLDAVPVDLPSNAAFASLIQNLGIEALAIDSAGTLFAVPEMSHEPKIPVYIYRNGQWRNPVSVPRIGTFRPVSADFGPDGRFYLLERRFDPLGGFASRLRRFDVERGGFSDGVILFQSTSGRHDNLEGLSVWRASDGLRATMISDDNFFPLQVSELVEYRLPD